MRLQGLKEVLAVYSPQLISANEAFHAMLTEGVPVTVMKDGQERGERVWLADFQNPNNNVFHAINQYTIVEKNQNKRPDVIFFVNGLLLVVIELKTRLTIRQPSARHLIRYRLIKQSSHHSFLIRVTRRENTLPVIYEGDEIRKAVSASPFTLRPSVFV